MENKMKSGEEAFCETGDTNLEEMVSSVLKTVSLTGGRYGKRYIIHLLICPEGLQFRKPWHGTIETIGALRSVYGYRVKGLVCYLIRKGMLSQSTGLYPLLRLTRRGREFLEQPVELAKPGERVLPEGSEYRLMYRLRLLREQLSIQLKLPLEDVLSDASLHHLVLTQPESKMQLLGIHGIGPWKLERFGDRILKVIGLFQEREKTRAVTRMLKTVTRPSLQQVKVLFEEGLDTEAIALRKGIRMTTVQGYLERLHMCGQIDLRPWIETRVDRKTLHRSAQFFREAADTRLRTAHEVLGLDLETLRLCRLYVQSPVALSKGQAA